MINYEGFSTPAVIFSWRGTTLQKTWANVLAVTAIGLTVNAICQFTGYPDIDTDAQQMPLIFVAILLVFRTGYAYGRFMEGRGHIGSMVFNVRDLARMLATFVVGDDPSTNHDRANTVRLLRAFTVSNRLSCRKQETSHFAELEDFLTLDETQRLREVKKNFPLIILQWVGRSLVKFKDKQMFARALDAMEEKVGELIAAWMGMQKLATTPFPFPYAQMCTFFLYLWCYTNPVAMAFSDHWYGAVVSTVIGFALFGINCIALELEDPFGEELNDLDLQKFEDVCYASCKALLPEALQPEDLEMKPGVPTGAGVAPQSALLSPHGPASASPVSPSLADPNAIIAEPGFGAKAQSEMLAAISMGALSAEMQAVFNSYFDRYDVNGSGKLDSSKELTQMVTNLAFALKLGAGLPKLLEEVDTVQNPDWNVDQFVEWFLQVVKMLPNLRT